MAVERVEQFVFDLGSIVAARLDSFVNARKSIRARAEAEFQRRIIDQDLTFQQQLEFRQLQLEQENLQTYPDNDFISELETEISNLKSLVKQRKYRDQYNVLLDEMVSGRKGLTDQISWLESQMQSEEWSREIKDQIQKSLQEAKRSKLEVDNKIIQSQIDFYEKDKTMASLNKALTLAQEGLSKASLANNQDLINQYRLKIQAINKSMRETEIEDKNNFLIRQIVSQDRTNNSLYKLDSLLSYANTASVDYPVTIGGKRYNSEKDFWNQQVNDYIKGNFASDYVQEEVNKFSSIYNQTGVLPASSIETIVNNIKNLRNRPEFAPYQSELNSITSSVLGELVKTKITEITSKYSLGTPVATTIDYQNALKEYKSLQSTFGNLHSIQSEIMKVETELAEMKAKQVSTLDREIAALMEKGITYEEAKKTALKAAAEIPREELVQKTPEEIITARVAPSLSANPADYYKVRTATGYDIFEKSTGKKMTEQELYLAPNAPKPNVTLIEERTSAVPTVTPTATTPKEGDVRTNPTTGVKEVYTPEGVWKPVSSTSAAPTPPAPTPSPAPTPPSPPPSAPAPKPINVSTQLGKQWTRKGIDVYEVINGQLGPKLSYEEFMRVWKPKGLNLDIIPQM